MSLKTKFSRLLLLGFGGLFFASACTSASDKTQQQNALLGGWIANAQGETIPAGASVFIGFWEGGAYTIVTRFNGKESRTQGLYDKAGNNLVFDGKTRYSFILNETTGTLRLVSANGTQTVYERVKMELLPADVTSR